MISASEFPRKAYMYEFFHTYMYHKRIYVGQHSWLRARRALKQFNAVPLTTRHGTLYSGGALLVLNGTSLNSVNALLALN